MEENKQVTADEYFYQKYPNGNYREFYDRWIIKNDMIIFGMEYANLKTQQLTWLSPVQEEREMQEQALERIFPDYPEGAFRWQYLNSLISAAEQVQQLTDENERLREVFEELLNVAVSLTIVNTPFGGRKKAAQEAKSYWREKAGINLTHKP